MINFLFIGYFSWFIFSCDSKFPDDFEPYCFEVIKENKRVKIWQSKKFNYYFDQLKFSIGQVEEPTKGSEIDYRFHEMYLQKTDDDAECDDYLEFGIVVKRPEVKSMISIYIHVYQEPGAIDSFEFLLTHGYSSRIINLITPDQDFAMDIQTIETRTIFHDYPQPKDFWSKVPKLEKSQKYCLKLQNYGEGVIDKFDIPGYTSSIFQHGKVVFSLFDEEKLATRTWLTGEITICDDEVVPLDIYIVKSNKIQTVTVSITLENGYNLFASFQFTPKNVQIFNTTVSNWHPRKFDIGAMTLEEVMNEKTGKPLKLIKRTNKLEYECNRERYEPEYLYKFISEKTVYKTDSRIYNKLPEDDKIKIGALMDEQQKEDCEKRAK